MKSVEIGDLTERVAFDSPAESPDGYGGIETGWADPGDAYQAWAHFRYLRGGEAVQAARLAGRQPVVATIRRTAGAAVITAAWRMRDLRRTEVYNIRTVVPTDDGRWFEITAETGVAT